MATGNGCNWPAPHQMGMPLAAFSKPLGHTAWIPFLQQLRGRFGSQFIAARTALPHLLQFARQPGVIALVANQLPRADEDEYWGVLLDRDTAFFAGPGKKLARLLKAPLVFAPMQRLRHGHFIGCASKYWPSPLPAGRGGTHGALQPDAGGADTRGVTGLGMGIQALEIPQVGVRRLREPAA